jgi:hypothetical protein
MVLIFGGSISVLQGPLNTRSEHPLQFFQVKLQIFSAGADAGGDVAKQRIDQFAPVLLNIIAAQT